MMKGWAYLELKIAFVFSIPLFLWDAIFPLLMWSLPAQKFYP